MTSAVWFRQDLRVYDNPALYAACMSSDPVIALYLFTPNQHRQHGVGDLKLRFMLENLVELEKDLARLNIPLVAVLATDYKDSVRFLAKLCSQYGISAIHANEETELNERRRDQLTQQQLDARGIGFHLYQDQTIIEPGQILTGEGQPYRVFTPFKRAWLKRIQTQTLQTLPAPKARPRAATGILPPTSTPADEILSWLDPVAANQHWVAGSQQAFQRLDRFTETALEHYHQERDYPCLDSTSQLSPYLASGAISVRSCMVQALRANHFEWDSGNKGILTWINELIWREFYKHLSYHYPSLSKGAAFNPKTETIPWSRNQSLIELWQRGATGFPLVDAGMRQLNELGWMHNRLRMVTAMFLTKHLFIDWRAGEAYFMQKLIDGDFAANNGGWQWSASTGADAAPYFRVFNPVRQSERFDAKGDFIRHWVPELTHLSPRQIHDPLPLERQQCGYPLPMVDHRSAVEHVKQAFKMAQSLEAV